MTTIALPRQSIWIRNVSLCVLGSFLISLFAKVSIPLPFTPIPLATQSIVLLILAVLLGRKSVFSVLGFLAQGCMGFPVFAGGACGIAKLFGPSGGYLIGYVVAAYVTGIIAEKKNTTLNIFFALLAGTSIILFLGWAYLSHFVGIQKGFLLGVAPFLVGDLLKIMIGLQLLKMWKK